MGIPTRTSDSLFDTFLLDQPVEIEIAANSVKTSSMSETMIEHTIDYSEVFPTNLPEELTIPTMYTDQTAILLSALSACVKAFCFGTLLNSSKLIRLIQKMDEIAHVAASSRIPVLLATASSERSVSMRRMAIDDPRPAALFSRG